MKTFCPKIRQRELDLGKTEREKEEEKYTDCFQPLSCCPACNQEYDMALILPCSHTLCGRCIAAGERTSSRPSLLHGVGLAVCSVLCPCCQHPVELPCWSWSSAASCLPQHPTLSPARVSQETGTKKGTSEDGLQHVQVRNPS